MARGKQGSEDFAEIAFRVFRQATEEELPEEQSQDKNPAAVALGRLGGLRGGHARAAKLTKEQRSDIARRAVLVRWERQRAERDKSEAEMSTDT